MREGQKPTGGGGTVQRLLSEPSSPVRQPQFSLRGQALELLTMVGACVTNPGSGCGWQASSPNCMDHGRAQQRGLKAVLSRAS